MPFISCSQKSLRGFDSRNMPVDFSDLQQSKCSTPELTLLFQGDSSFCVSTLVNLSTFDTQHLL